jgi:hypothetical protein
MNASPIFARTYDLILWLIPHTLKFPRSQRFVLGKTVPETLLRFQELLIEATQNKTPIEKLKQADTQLQKLRFYLRQHRFSCGGGVIEFDHKPAVRHARRAPPVLAFEDERGLSPAGGLPQPKTKMLHPLSRCKSKVGMEHFLRSRLPYRHNL